MRINLLITYAIIFLPVGIFGQNTLKQLPDEKKPRVEAVYCKEKINIDGKLDELSWQQCTVQAGFRVSFPAENKVPYYDTDVRIMYDDKNIYIGAVCHYDGFKNHLQVQNLARDFSYSESELFNVMLGTFEDHNLPVMSFSVSPYSTQVDIMHYADGSYDYKWNALWYSKCRIEDSIWIAEIAIPFSSLRYPGTSGTWRINFTRNNRYTGELSGWSLWPRAYSASRLEYGGLLVNLHPPKPKLNMLVQPYALVKPSKGDSKFQAGGEVKFAASTNTVIDATINTDFAQAEVDRQVINLTRSSVFFPERRQFFLENANLFSIGQPGLLQPFFSRRIGIGSNGSIIPIQGGLRFIDQNSKQSIGMLFMKEKGDSSNSPSWINVWRYKSKLGKRFQIGVMEVMRYYERTKQQASSFNPVSCADIFWRMSPSSYLRSMVSYASDSRTKRSGFASLAEWNYNNNLITADLIETIAGRGYNAETGFLSRQNFINTRPSVYLNIHKKWFPRSLAFYRPVLSADMYHEASSGIFQEATLTATPFGLVFNNLSQCSFNVYNSWQHLAQDFFPVQDIAVAGGKYFYTRYELAAQTSQAAHYSIKFAISTGGYYNGKLNSYSMGLRLAPIPNTSVTINYTKNDFKGLGIMKANTVTQLLAPETLFALNANLQASCIYQYNSQARSGAVNARISWQYKPLSFIYLVYNSARYEDAASPSGHTTERSGIIKFYYTMQL